MMQRLLGGIDGWASSAILLREAARSSRRWQTYAARTGFSGMLLAVLLLGIWSFVNTNEDPADMGWMGRSIFVAFSTVLVLLAVTLSPLTTSSAIIEESEDRTLEMLLLSKLTPSRILVGKVLSRILVLITVVFGAMPVLAMVVTLGGVAPHQVVAVIIHSLVAVVLTGTLGAFYGLFTRSPLLATLAASCYGVVAFLVVPVGYGIAVANFADAGHFSLIAGAFARDWTSLIAVFSYLPSLAVMFVVGTRLFELQIANADIRHAFSAPTWGTESFVKATLFASVSGFLVVLPASICLYTLRIGGWQSWYVFLLVLGARFVVWAWFSGVLAVASWVMLRVGVDVVDALDSILAGRRGHRGEPLPVRVWGNPVAWREARPGAWGANGLPLLVTWLLAMLGMIQTGWWLIPGGGLAMGALNTLAALGLTLWLAARTIDEDRRHDTLLLLLTTTMSSFQIVLGKAAGIAVLSGPLLVFSAPFFVIGVPYAEVLFAEKRGVMDGVMRGLLMWVWTVPLWLTVLFGSLAVALRLRQSRSAFAVTSGLFLGTLGVPAVLAHIFNEHGWITLPSRILAPPLAGQAVLWQYMVSIGGWTMLALALAFYVTYGLRRWFHIGAGLLLAFGLAAVSPAQAQVAPMQDDFVIAVHPLGEGLVRTGQWAAVRVQIHNRGPTAVGTLSLEQRAVTGAPGVARPIRIDEGGRVDVTLLYRPNGSTSGRTITLLTPTRKAEAEFRTRNVRTDHASVGVFGIDLLGLPSLDTTFVDTLPGPRPREPLDDVVPVHAGLVDPAGLPSHSAAYAPFDQLIWLDAEPGEQDPDKQRALVHWVADGGHLVVSVTDHIPSMNRSALADLLPLTITSREDKPGVLEAFGYPAEPLALPVALSTPRLPEGRTLLRHLDLPDGTPLMRSASFGLGVVTVLTVDPRLAPLRAHRTALWQELLLLAPDDEDGDLPLRRALDTTPPEYSVFDGAVHWQRNWTDEPANSHGSVLRKWLSDIPGIAPIPVQWLLAFSVLYLFVIGPLDLVVLRLLKRQPLTWITFPLAIVVFSAIALVGTSMLKGREAVVRVVQVVDLLPGTGLWRGEDHLAIFATAHTDLRVTAVHEDATLDLDEHGFASTPLLHAGNGPGSLTYTAETWTLGYSRARWVDQAPGTLTAQRDGEVVHVTNSLGFPVNRVAVLVPGEEPLLVWTEALASGETGSVRLSSAEPLVREEDAMRTLIQLAYDVPQQEGGYLDVNAAGLVLIADAPAIPLPRVEGVQPQLTTRTLIRVAIP